MSDATPVYLEAISILSAALRRLAEGDYNPDKPGEAVFEIAARALGDVDHIQPEPEPGPAEQPAPCDPEPQRYALAAQERPAPGERSALEDIARAGQGSIDTSIPLDRDWLVDRALEGLGRLPEGCPKAPRHAPGLAAQPGDRPAVLADVTQQRDDLDDALTALRGGIGALLADVARSAEATRPSRKTETEDEFAIALRRLLEAP